MGQGIGLKLELLAKFYPYEPIAPQDAKSLHEGTITLAFPSEMRCKCSRVAQPYINVCEQRGKLGTMSQLEMRDYMVLDVVPAKVVVLREKFRFRGQATE